MSAGTAGEDGGAATTAPVHGPRWGARAEEWAALTAGLSRPAWQAVADAAGVGAGTRLLDVGCGSGELCVLASERGAIVSGIDAAEGMIAVARRRLPRAELRVGAMERLPWPAGAFDVVTLVNSLQLAADPVTALAEARRVVRPGGRVAACVWGPPEVNETTAIMAALRPLQPPPPPGAPEPPRLGDPGALEDLTARAGLSPEAAGEVDVPFVLADQRTLVRALLAPGAVQAAIERAGEPAVRAAIVAAAAPFRRPDGSYRMENRFRYLVAAVPG